MIANVLQQVGDHSAVVFKKSVTTECLIAGKLWKSVIFGPVVGDWSAIEFVRLSATKNERRLLPSGGDYWNLLYGICRPVDKWFKTTFPDQADQQQVFGAESESCCW